MIVKWFKPMFLTGAMAVVTWGVWHTLTQQPDAKTAPGFQDDNAPQWAKNGSSKSDDGSSASPFSPGSPSLGAGSSSGSAVGPGDGSSGSRYEGNAPNASIPGDPFAGRTIPPSTNDYKGPPIATSPPMAVDPIASRVGNRVEPRPGVNQPAATPETSLETRRLNDLFDASMKSVKNFKAARQLGKAYEEACRWYPQIDELTRGRSSQLLKELDELAGEVLYSQNSYLSPPYQVSAGDTLLRIAAPHNIPPNLLVKVNRLARPDQPLVPGQKLKVVHGPFHAEIRLKKFELTLLMGDQKFYAGRFRIGVGKEGPFQLGVYTIERKKMFPDYYPDPSNPQRVIPGGDKFNALGTRLIVFAMPGKTDSKFDGALHGTNEPTTIPGKCNEGSIRLEKDDIENLYDMLLENVSQVIVRE